jgi:hypothetical protein
LQWIKYESQQIALQYRLDLSSSSEKYQDDLVLETTVKRRKRMEQDKEN